MGSLIATIYTRAGQLFVCLMRKSVMFHNNKWMRFCYLRLIAVYHVVSLLD
jgi:hypothetical protein